MPGVLLAVNHGDLVYAAKGHQCRKRDLGGVRLMGEHRFAKYPAAQVDAVQPAHQFAIHPGFYAVGMSSPVKAGVGLHHIRNNPGARLARARLAGTGIDDALEGTVKAKLATGLRLEAGQGLAQRAMKLEMRCLQDHAWVGAPPKRWLAQAKPRENSVRISLDQCR